MALIMLSAANQDLWSQEEEQRPPRYQEALDLYEKGDYEQSLAVIRDVFDAHRNSMELRLLASANYAARGEFDQARAHMEYCINDHPRSVEPRVMLAGIWRRQNKPYQTIEVARRGIAAAGDHVMLRLEIASAYFMLNRYANAREHIRQALALDSHNVHAIYLDGLIFLKQGSFENASFRFQSALDRADQLNRNELVNLYINMGFAHEKMGDGLIQANDRAQGIARYRDAIRYYNYALRIDPQNEIAPNSIKRVEARPTG
ncbi:MAG: tetratricopeptide repeat protein [Leptospiraceae bacterium]|nr:tetratricopeptide repeat protein [Leptospiraceae bacterium]